MKKLIFGGIMAAMLGTGAFFASQKKQTSELSEIQMANIEALAADEGGKNNCDYANGYKAFKSIQGGGAYDCCKVWRAFEIDKSQGPCQNL